MANKQSTGLYNVILFPKSWLRTTRGSAESLHCCSGLVLQFSIHTVHSSCNLMQKCARFCKWPWSSFFGNVAKSYIYIACLPSAVAAQSRYYSSSRSLVSWMPISGLGFCAYLDPKCILEKHPWDLVWVHVFHNWQEGTVHQLLTSSISVPLPLPCILMKLMSEYFVLPSYQPRCGLCPLIRSNTYSIFADRDRVSTIE